MPLLQLRKQPAALDRRQLTIIARENELGPAAPRLDQKLACYARVEHRRLVDDDDRALVPNRAAVLEAEQFGMHGRSAGKAVRLQIFRDAVCRREAHDAAPLLLVRVADGGERKALAGAGAALDDLQPARARGVVERRTLILAQRFSRQRASLGPLRRGLVMARVGQRPRFLQSLALLGPHRPRRKAPGRLAGLALKQGKRLLGPEHFPLNAQPLRINDNVLGEIAIEVALRKRRIVAGQRLQHFCRIARGLRIRARDLLRPLVGFALHRPHAQRPDMLLRMRRRGVDPHIDPMRHKIAVLVLPPQLPPLFALRDEAPRARLPDVRRKIARLRRGETIALDAAGRNQKMRVPISALALQIAAMRRVNVELNREPLGDEVLRRERAREFDPVLVRNLRVRRQRHDDFAGDLRILAPLRRLRRVPQGRGVGKFFIRAGRQQHLVVLGRIAVLEVENFARALVADLGARVIRG